MTHTCKRAGGFVDSACTAICDCHETMVISDMAGPVGYQHIETAPKDGSWLRFRFRRVEYEDEIIGRWEPHAEMKAGGSWFDRDGSYITPGPIFWAPGRMHHLAGCPSGDFGPCDCPPPHSSAAGQAASEP